MKTLNVTGMTCNHCKMNIEKFVSKIEGVTSVEADYEKNTVKVEGNPDWNEVKEIIGKLGYKVVD